MGYQTKGRQPKVKRDPTIATSPDEWLHLPAAAKHVNKPERFMRRLVMERRIRYYKHGRYLAFRRSDLDAWATSDCREPWQ